MVMVLVGGVGWFGCRCPLLGFHGVAGGAKISGWCWCSIGYGGVGGGDFTAVS